MPNRSLKGILISANPSGAVGITNMMNVFLRLPFENQRQKTFSADIQLKKIPVVFNIERSDEEDGVCAFSIIDTSCSSTERWQMARTCSVAIVCFSVTDSLEDNERFVSECVAELRRSAPRAAVILAANKIDLPDRAVSQTQVAELAKQTHVEIVIECSAKKGTGITELFDEAIAAGFDALDGTSVAIIEPPQQQHSSATTTVVIADAPRDIFATQLVKREVVLTPPVLVPTFKREDDNDDDTVKALLDQHKAKYIDPSESSTALRNQPQTQTPQDVASCTAAILDMASKIERLEAQLAKMTEILLRMEEKQKQQ